MPPSPTAETVADLYTQWLHSRTTVDRLARGRAVADVVSTSAAQLRTDVAAVRSRRSLAVTAQPPEPEIVEVTSNGGRSCLVFVLLTVGWSVVSFLALLSWQNEGFGGLLDVVMLSVMAFFGGIVLAFVTIAVGSSPRRRHVRNIDANLAARIRFDFWQQREGLRRRYEAGSLDAAGLAAALAGGGDSTPVVAAVCRHGA